MCFPDTGVHDHYQARAAAFGSRFFVPDAPLQPEHASAHLHRLRDDPRHFLTGAKDEDDVRRVPISAEWPPASRWR